MRKWTLRELTFASVIAAVYTLLTLNLPVPQYGAVQLRLAEAMTVLPFLFPAAVPGLAVGCFLSNLLGSPFVLDWVFGTAATLLAAVWTARLHKHYLAPLPPVVCNAVIIGAEIALSSTASLSALPAAFAFNALSVGLGELIACFALGLPLLAALWRVPFLRDFIPAPRRDLMGAGGAQTA